MIHKTAIPVWSITLFDVIMQTLPNFCNWPVTRGKHMFDFINDWYRRYFTHPQAAVLVILLAAAFVVFYFMGGMLTPLLAAVVIAYMLEGPIVKLTARQVPRLTAVSLVFLLFILIMGFIVIGLLPILSGQASQFVQEFPGMLSRGQELLLHLPEQYPDIISAELVNEIGLALRRGASDFGQGIVSVSVASIPAMRWLVVE